MSKLDYANVVYNDIPQYLLKRLQKVQNAAAGFVLNRRATISDVIKLKWLPIKERIDHAVAVLAFKALSDQTSPPNIKLKLKEDRRELRNQTAIVGPKIESLDKLKTFQTCAALVFNNLPKKIRENHNLNIFKQETKKFLLDRAVAHTRLPLTLLFNN